MPGLKGKLLHNEPLAPLTSWRIGGAAQKIYWPADLLDLQNFLQTLPLEEEIFWLGLGSNVLIRDGGFKGTVICTHKSLTTVNILEKNPHYIRFAMEAGVTCAKIAKIAAKEGYIGGEFFAGIPGTLGGALAMNAGAWGSETWDFVESVEMIDKHGNITQHKREDFTIAYRLVKFPKDHWFVSAVLKFNKGDVLSAQAKIKELLNKRSLSQPIGELSCGSVFKNPQNAYAAQLIEQLNLKGTRIGGAVVSHKHANFIINEGEALASHIEELIQFLQDAVLRAYNMELMLEVKIIGDLL
jgi:UDP-N-acetylmuramate dehydrogenase